MNVRRDRVCTDSMEFLMGSRAQAGRHECCRQRLAVAISDYRLSSPAERWNEHVTFNALRFFFVLTAQVLIKPSPLVLYTFER